MHGVLREFTNSNAMYDLRNTITRRLSKGMPLVMYPTLLVVWFEDTIDALGMKAASTFSRETHMIGARTSYPFEVGRSILRKDGEDVATFDQLGVILISALTAGHIADGYNVALPDNKVGVVVEYEDEVAWLVVKHDHLWYLVRGLAGEIA